jgi:NTE family protein
VLSGGGAKGAFQVGAERVLREERGYRWDRIFGVSVGALNAALLAQEEYDRLRDAWLQLREEDVHQRYGWPLAVFRLAILKRLGAYDNTPLRRTIERHAAGRPFRIPAHAGRVSLRTGAYELVSSDAPDFLDAVWQSATIPVVWEPVGEAAWVDGGLRNVTPLGDALDYSPSEVVVIVTGRPDLPEAGYPRHIVDVAKRSLVDITLNEIMLRTPQAAAVAQGTREGRDGWRGAPVTGAAQRGSRSGRR